MIIARIIQAVGGGMLIPISMAMIYLIVPEQKTGVVLGVWGIAAVMGPAIYLHTLSLATSFGQVQLILALRALGLGLCMMPLANAPMLTVPEHLVGSASSVLNLVRQVVASIAVAFTTYFVSQRHEYHLSIITEGINQSSPTSLFIIAQVQGYLTAQGLGGDTPLAVTLSVIKSMALKQAYMNGIDDIMVLMSLLALAGFPLLFLLSKKRVDREKLRQGINTPANHIG